MSPCHVLTFNKMYTLKTRMVCGASQFLQMENEAVREQTVEIEELYQASLQGLRERNNQCEDLKGAVSRLQ